MRAHDPEPSRRALVMVGLPARGKTFVGTKLNRYLSWLGYRSRVFNVGDYRRARGAAGRPASFFDPDNAAGQAARHEYAEAALDDLLDWLDDGGEVALYDATNVERARREAVAERCHERGVRVAFVEPVCEDPVVIEANIRETKARSPDYVNVPADDAVRDFRERIAHYQRIYEPLGEADAHRSYVKLVDVGRQVVINRMDGYLAGRLVHFLMNVHPARRRIWLTRHGESEYNLMGRIGGDSPLTARGRAFASALGELMEQRVGQDERLVVWTSTLRRTLETASALPVPGRAWRALDEIDAGVCDGMTYGEIAARLPEEFAARAADKLRYRYPRGESYADVIQRLEPLIVELERQRDPALVVGHQAVLRALYGYLSGRPQEECPFLEVPLHTVLELTPTAYGYDERWFPLR